MAAVLAGLDMTAEGGGAAVLDRRHDLKLMQAQVPGLGGAISGAGGSEDIGDLERGAHRLSRRECSLLCSVYSGAASIPSLSSGLITARTVRVATLV